MANSKDTPAGQPPDTSIGAPMFAPSPDPVNAQSKALADASVTAKEQHTDDGDEGGHYIVNGVHVDSNGDPIKKFNKQDAKTNQDGQ